MKKDLDRDLSVEELEEVAGGAEANLYCPTTNEKSCNTSCAPATDASVDG